MGDVLRVIAIYALVSFALIPIWPFAFNREN